MSTPTASQDDPSRPALTTPVAPERGRHAAALGNRRCSITRHDTPEAAVVTVVGEVDLDVQDDLDHALGSAADQNRHVVVDMTGITFCASTGLNLLIRHGTALHRRGHKLVIATTASVLLRPIQLMKIEHLFTITDDLAQALELVRSTTTTE